VTASQAATIAYWYDQNVRTTGPKKFFTFEIHRKPVAYM